MKITWSAEDEALAIALIERTVHGVEAAVREYEQGRADEAVAR